MATGNRRDVELSVGVTTTGTDSLSTLRSEIDKLAGAGGESAGELNKLAAALDSAAAETQQFAQAEKAVAIALAADKAALAERRDALSRMLLTTDQATRSTAEFKGQVAAERVALIDARTAIRAKESALSEAVAATRQATAAEQQLVKQAQAVTDSFKKQTEQISASSKSLTSIGDSVVKFFGRFAVAAGALITGRGFIDIITQAESLKRGLEAVSGGSKQAADTLTYLKSTSNALGLEVQSTSRAFVSLSAATQGTALEGEPTRQVFEAISRAMSTLGKSGAETERALQAVAQIASKGTASMEELRGQLGEALPGALKAAADGAGITTAQLIELVSAGNVAAKDLLPALTRGLDKLYANGGPPDTLIANWNRFKNVITESAVALVSRPVNRRHK